MIGNSFAPLDIACKSKHRLILRFSDIRVRLGSAIIIGIILISPFLITDWLYVLPFTAMALLMGLEFVHVQVKGYPGLRIMVGVLCALTYILMFFTGEVVDSAFFRVTFPMLCIVLNIYWISNLFSNRISSLIGSSYVVKSFTYIALNLSSMHLILHYKGVVRSELFIICMVMVWLSDILAFGSGSIWGRRKLFPSVSPKKTVEGLAGSMIGTSLLSVLFAIVFGHSVFLLLVLSISISGTVILGDLVESKFKRTAGVKDSGTLIPGHGGVLDRFDGFLFAMPVAALIIEIYQFT